MIYFGVDLLDCAYSITALSEGFAVLDSRDFYTNFTAFSEKRNGNSIVYENDLIFNWANSIKCKHKEKSYWYFDEYNFYHYLPKFEIFKVNKFFDELFLVDHRRLINLH